MSILNNIISSLFTQKPEIAAAEIEVLDTPSPEEQYNMYLTACITRANNILDKHKDKIFSQVLNLGTVGRMQRAVLVYDKPYLLALGLSLEATAELAEELMVLAKKYKVTPPSAWKEAANMDFGIENEEIEIVNRVRPVV